MRDRSFSKTIDELYYTRDAYGVEDVDVYTYLCYNIIMTTPESLPYGLNSEQYRMQRLMTRALDVMQPNDDHHIVIEGIQPDTRTLRDLETRFNLTLEASLGSTLGLHYSQRSKGFVLNELQIPIQGMDGSISLQRTNLHEAGFLPIVRIGDTYNEAPSQAWDPSWHLHLSERILEGHGIDAHPPTQVSRDTYLAWHASAMFDGATSWRMHEETEINRQRVVNGSLGSITGTAHVMRDQFVPHDTLMSTETIAIAYDIEDDSDSERSVHRETLELTTHQDEARFICTSQVLQRLPSPFTSDQDALIPASEKHFRSATQDDFLKYSRIIETARYPSTI